MLKIANNESHTTTKIVENLESIRDQEKLLEHPEDFEETLQQKLHKLSLNAATTSRQLFSPRKKNACDKKDNQEDDSN